MAVPVPADVAGKGSCEDYGFGTAEQRRAYLSVLQRLKVEGVFAKLEPNAQGVIFINVPFAGKFDEQDLLVEFLGCEVLDVRTDIRFIRIFVTDVQDFFTSRAKVCHDPRVNISYSVQDGTAPLPRAHLTLGMHPDCSSRFLTDFGPAYQRYYFLWQQILFNACSSSDLAVFCNLWLEEAIECQNVAKQAGLLPSPALKNEIYYDKTLTAPLTGNKRDRRPFHFITIAEGLPLQVVPKISTTRHDYAGPYHNMWTLNQRALEAAKLRAETGLLESESDSELESIEDIEEEEEEDMEWAAIKKMLTVNIASIFF